jgi:DUF4097 and DUF4098 domain-containing protein YvlB
MKSRVLTVAVVLSLTGAALAQQPGVRRSTRYDQKFTIAPGGTFALDNPIGNIEITGADVTDVEATIGTTIVARDEAMYEEAKRQSGFLVEGTPTMRVVRTASVANQVPKPWSVTVHWSLRVPRSVTVRVISSFSDRIRIVNLQGNVYVKNFNGNVALMNITGATFVESVNGSIVYSTPQPRGNVVLSTVNGEIVASVAANADLRWIAKSVTGDIRTNMPVRGAFYGATFRGSVNAPGGPTLTTSALMGNIHLLASGSSATASQSLYKLPTVDAPTMTNGQQTSAAGGRADYRRNSVTSLKYATSIGDVKVGEIRGDADIFTGAGQVQLGAVSGPARVRSLGGPLHLGEMLGVLTASTRAGDILVDSTRRGGTISTEGGTISLLYTGGPTRLISGGGDITVRQAAAPITAETTSGDIAITIDSTSKTETIDAKTGKGNVIVNVPPKFRGEIDATIITKDANADTIVSDLPGLSISREQMPGGLTRIHATGKINGGGEKVVLQATSGDIRISTGRVAPTLVKPR